MEKIKNPGLRANVVSMYKSRLEMEEFFRPKIVENLKISGKLKAHIIDIYVEFIQMNNLERTIIKTIEGNEVTEGDIWELGNTLKDLHFFAKGILYYDNKVSDKARELAGLFNIELKKFDFVNEVRKNVISAIKTILPDEDIIGDPFWVVMETSQCDGENTGNYSMFNNGILLFLSKKQASNYCSRLKNANVFGISQRHLRVLIALQENDSFPQFYIVLPEFEQINKDSIACYSISSEMFKKFYLRG